MDTAGILAALRAERDRIGKAIEALEALDNMPASRSSPRVTAGAAKATSKPIRRRKPLSAAAKKHLSAMMKKRWAERKRKQRA